MTIGKVPSEAPSDVLAENEAYPGKAFREGVANSPAGDGVGFRFAVASPLSALTQLRNEMARICSEI